MSRKLLLGAVVAFAALLLQPTQAATSCTDDDAQEVFGFPQRGQRHA